MTETPYQFNKRNYPDTMARLERLANRHQIDPATEKMAEKIAGRLFDVR